MGGIFHFYSKFKRNFCKQTVKNLIRRRILRRLIWFCTVCWCPAKKDSRLKWVNITVFLLLGCWCMYSLHKLFLHGTDLLYYLLGNTMYIVHCRLKLGKAFTTGNCPTMYLIIAWKWTILKECKISIANECMLVKLLKFQTIFTLFSNKMLVIRAGIYKMFVRIANREDPDQTASSDCLGLVGRQVRFKIWAHLL